MGTKRIIPVVAACILREHPTRFLLHRKDESRNPELVGKWEFPGGAVEITGPVEYPKGEEWLEKRLDTISRI